MVGVDARKFDATTLTKVRQVVITRIQAGESPELIAKVMGFSRGAVYNWMALYRSGGWGALDAKKRGGRPTKLDGKALAWIYRTVTSKNPLQLKFPFALWTSFMVGQLIRERFGIRLSRASVCRLMSQMGLSPQRPLWRAYQQNPEMVTKWMAEEYPRIKAEAHRCGAEIFFGDEAGVRSDFHAGTTWGIKGKTPIVSSTGARFSFNMISAVSSRGVMRFMVIKGSVGAKTFLQFLKRLIHGATTPIFLIVDGHSIHRAKIVTTYVASVHDRLRLFSLPPYAPELNPDEHVWNDLKNQAVGRTAIASSHHLKKTIVSHLRFLQKRPDLIRAFFQSPTTKYAA